MQYTTSIEIARPRGQVLALISDPAHAPKWLRGLVVHEPMRGIHGQVGTVSRVVFQMGGQRMEATETITRLEPQDLLAVPSSVVVHYEREIAAAGVWQAQRDRFCAAGPQTTLWESESEFRFDGLLMRLAGMFMPGSFRKQSRQHLFDFKAFAEHGTVVNPGAR